MKEYNAICNKKECKTTMTDIKPIKQCWNCGGSVKAYKNDIIGGRKEYGWTKVN